VNPTEGTAAMNVIVVVDPDTCIGSGECIALDPEAVDLDEQGTARILLAEMDEQRAERLCGICPVGALSIEGR
jgi:ferredoxin